MSRRTPTDNFPTWEELDREQRRRRTRFADDVVPDFGAIDKPSKAAWPRVRLIDQFLAAARHRRLDVGEAVRYMVDDGLDRPGPIESTAGDGETWTPPDPDKRKEHSSMQVFNPELEYDGREAIILSPYNIDNRSRILVRLAVLEAAGGLRTLEVRLPLRFTIENQLGLHRGRIISGKQTDDGLVLRLGEIAASDCVASLPA